MYNEWVGLKEYLQEKTELRTYAACVYFEAELVEKARIYENLPEHSKDNLNQLSNTVISMPTITCQ